MCNTNAGGLVDLTGVTSEGNHASLWQARVAVGQLEEAIPAGMQPNVFNTEKPGLEKKQKKKRRGQPLDK